MTIIKPSVFKVTVLPPVFGPVIMTVSTSSINSIVFATTVSLSNKGLNALGKYIVRSSLNVGFVPFIVRA